MNNRMVTRDCVIGRNTRWFGWTNPIRHMPHSHEPIKLDWGADGAEANQRCGWGLYWKKRRRREEKERRWRKEKR